MEMIKVYVGKLQETLSEFLKNYKEYKDHALRDPSCHKIFGDYVYLDFETDFEKAVEIRHRNFHENSITKSFFSGKTTSQIIGKSRLKNGNIGSQKLRRSGSHKRQ